MNEFLSITYSTSRPNPTRLLDFAFVDLFIFIPSVSLINSITKGLAEQMTPLSSHESMRDQIQRMMEMKRKKLKRVLLMSFQLTGFVTNDSVHLTRSRCSLI